MKRVLGLLAALLLMGTMLACQKVELRDIEKDKPAEKVLINGKILTVDNDFSIAEAIAVNGERIIAVGNNAAIENLVGDTTEVIDLDGKTVIPGLIDNHFHFTRAVERWHMQARLDNVYSRAEALDILAAKAASMEPGEWMMVQGGWSPSQFSDKPGGFTLEELDAVSPNNPLFVQKTYELVYLNSLALEAIGMSAKDGAAHSAMKLATPFPPYGALVRAIPKTSESQREQNLTDFMQELNRVGLTGVYALGRSFEGDISVVAKKANQQKLPVRVWYTLRYQANNNDEAIAAAKLIRESSPNTFDGYFGQFGLGEHVYNPFFDMAFSKKPYPQHVVDSFIVIAEAAAETGWYMQEHTINENVTIAPLLAGFEELNETVPITSLRWSLAHVFDISKESINKARDLGMTLAVHSIFTHDRKKKNMHRLPDGTLVEPLGPPLRDIQDSGIIWGLGSDGTVGAHYPPFITLGWAVSGLNPAGKPQMAQTVTREEALIAHTRSNAYMLSQEDNLGTLEAGKYADLVVLDRDYMSVPVDQIREIQPLLTMTGGKIVFDELR